MIDNTEMSKRHRPVEQISADIGELDAKIDRLNRQRDALMLEHAEATEDKFPKVF